MDHSLAVMTEVSGSSYGLCLFFERNNEYIELTVFPNPIKGISPTEGDKGVHENTFYQKANSHIRNSRRFVTHLYWELSITQTHHKSYRTLAL